MSPQKKTFLELLTEQVSHEFSAAQHYLASAVWLDREDLPRLAAHFYRQSLEERNHALMMVRYFLDRGEQIDIPGVPAVTTNFADVQQVVEIALAQEKTVTTQIEALAKTARNEGDYVGEQFTHWFLKEQVEEVASMSTLLTIVNRAKASGNLFHVEDYLAREQVGDGGADPDAPAAAGGAL